MAGIGAGDEFGDCWECGRSLAYGRHHGCDEWWELRDERG